MSSPASIENNRPPVAGGLENRKHPRKPGKAVIEVTRERDHRRILLPVHLVDISVNGVGLIVGEMFTVGEGVKILLRNDARRYSKQVPGTVRWSKPTADGKFQVGIGLNVWFTPRDMQLMTQSGFSGAAGETLMV
jgi:hypothetical protein